MLEKFKEKQQKLKSTTLAIGFSALLFPLSVVAPAISFAEVLNMPETPQAFSITLPGRGMSMTEVLEKFGEPKSKDPEVGEPPITRWRYDNYNVVFEYQYVIHALATNKPMGLMLPEEPAATMETKSEAPMHGHKNELMPAASH